MRLVSTSAALLAFALLAAPAMAEEGKTSGPASGSGTTEPSSKGGGSADKAMQEGPASADKGKQQGASESSSGAK